MDEMILLATSILLGGFSAWRLTSLSRVNSELKQNAEKTALEAQQALHEMLSRRQGLDSLRAAGWKADFDFTAMVATPVFAIACLALAGVFWAHPDALPISQLIRSLEVKPVALLIGQIWFLSMFVCSCILVFNQGRK